MTMVEFYIARRYVRSKRGIRFINIIGSVSIVGITLGVAALLIALSVFNGFSAVVTGVLVGFDPHVRIEKAGGMLPAERAKLEELLRSEPGVEAYSPFVTGKAMLSTGAFNQVVFVRGVDEHTIGAVSGLGTRMQLGSLALGESTGVSGILIGLTLADRLAALIGDQLTVYSPAGIQQTLTGGTLPQGSVFRVAGIYEAQNKDYDLSYAYISLSAAQELYMLGDRVHGIDLRLTSFSDADRVKESLKRRIHDESVTVSTWFDLHRSLYTVMKIERWSAYILLSLIIVVASFNMLGSLTMTVLEKRRDIAVLRSMGMTAKGIVRLFMLEGMLIGVIGTILGVSIGLLVLNLQIHYRLFPLDPTIYIIPAIPVEIHWTDFLAIVAASLGLSVLAAYYPARRAAAVLPSEALRWE
jgi:lipoprotein-releasing system permease protein